MKIEELCIVCLIIILAFTTPGRADIDPDTIAGLWLFDEGKGDTVLDSSGNGYDGVLEGNPSWVDGRFGIALEFTGSDYVELQNSAAGLPFGGVEPFTITAWVKNQGGGTVIGKFNGGVIGAYILVIGGGGGITFHREVAPWGLAGSQSLPTGEFAHVAATYDGSEMRIYVDGELDTKEERPGQNTDMATPVLIGARFTSGNPSEFFRGVLDEVALFNVALDERQIEEVMSSLSPEGAVFASGKLASKWGSIKSQP